MKKAFTLLVVGMIAVISLVSAPAQAGQGCCSHHGGECGCVGGRDLCCDHTLSPSCRC